MPYKMPPDLLNSLKSGNIIPVVGAGVSMSLHDNAGERIFPSWVELLEYAADELRLARKEDLANGIIAMLGLKQFQLAARFAREGLNDSRWSQFFKKYFEEPLTRISDDSKALPMAIWGLGNRVLTLNYDKVLRGACPVSERLIELDNNNRAELADFKRNTLQAPAIWHFHGRIDNISTLIFTAESYDALYIETDKDYKSALDVFRGLCRDQRLLFVGCSLEDAELLHEMAKQHQLFDGNTGPHYALIRQDQHDVIRQKIAGLPLELLTFESFGDPLVKMVNIMASQVPRQQSSDQLTGYHHPIEQKQLIGAGGKKIALLSARPLDENPQYAELLKEFRKIACHIDSFALSVDNLNRLNGYDYLLILSKVIKNKILIENDHLCSRRISFKEFEEHIGNERTAGVFIFVDQLPDLESIRELDLPTLILPELEKKQLEMVAFQLFRKNNLDYFKDSLLLNLPNFELCPLVEKIKENSNILQKITPLPDSIDPKTVRNFIGRTGDLEQICSKLLGLKDQGGVLTIKGAGGIGKTTTVKKVVVALAERGYFDGGISFVDCEPITDSQQFRYKVAGSFNLEQAEDLKLNLRDHHDGQSRLIILDNFETLLYLDDHKEIKSLLRFVCDYATIVITSRELLQVEGELVWEMRQFTTDEAAELFLSGLDQRVVSSDDLAFLRQEIIENLLDNNPLAIKLITGNMPKGKSFAALKEELETDLFSKISDSELKVFDDSSDKNIARKKSIYGSILYSYNHLTDNEQRAFELLSLFPDGIELETFKQLTKGQKITKNSSSTELQQSMITDKIIKALENKSIIENNSEKIKLQSIVGKFAEGQLRRRDNLTSFYRNAFEYNYWLILGLVNLRQVDERRSLEIFNSQQGNFLKCITYCDKGGAESSEIIKYLDYLCVFFVDICSLGGLLREASAKVDHFHGRDRQCVETLLLSAKYFAGDFDSAYSELKKVAPMDELITLGREYYNERSLANAALNIYSMEGEALSVVKLYVKQKRNWHFYSEQLLFLGEFDRNLADGCIKEFFTLEVLGNMGLLTVEPIDYHLSSLYEKAHLMRMQVSYTRSKLSPLKRQEIESLITVSPYTRGLKCLMLAFIETDFVKAMELYEKAIGQLGHIKYYYAEALYFYSKFLQTHNPAGFKIIYRQGLKLVQKYHYRFLQYRFEQLLNPTGMVYDHRNYPLPNNESFTDYIQFLIKDNKHHKAKR